jgi:hypothetical protein
VTESGRAELLALAKRGNDFRWRDPEPTGGKVRQLVEERTLVAGRQAGLDRVEIQEIGQAQWRELCKARARISGGGS